VEATTGQDDNVVDRALHEIRAAGGRVTPAKRTLLEVLEANPGHHSADELISLIQPLSPEIAGSTIYRILEEFERIGVVEHSHSGRGAATYHLRSEAHGHLVCQRCGTMIEAPPSIYAELSEQAQQRWGFLVDPHHFAVLGTCERCRVGADGLS